MRHGSAAAQKITAAPTPRVWKTPSRRSPDCDPSLEGAPYAVSLDPRGPARVRIIGVGGRRARPEPDFSLDPAPPAPAALASCRPARRAAHRRGSGRRRLGPLRRGRVCGDRGCARTCPRRCPRSDAARRLGLRRAGRAAARLCHRAHRSRGAPGGRLRPLGSGCARAPANAGTARDRAGGQVTMRALKAALLVALLFAAPRSARAAITIVNLDGAGEGFNDPTAAAPVGGNPGTTIGQQRLNAFNKAAQIWDAILGSPVNITIEASFDPLSCNATTAALGSAGPNVVDFNFPGAGFANTWYVSAEADRLAGVDLDPGFNDIGAQFNSSIGQAGCLTGRFWYYGYDGNEGNNIDLLPVLLHE